MSVSHRKIFKEVRGHNSNDIKENFKNSYSDLTCDRCEAGSIESQSHAVMCSGWEDQRQGLELTKIEDMVVFFNRILKEKGKKEG